jgi:PKD repeat protein
MMTGPETQAKQTPKRRWNIFRFDLLLLVFLLVGWSLIFTTATLGLQSIEQSWLPVPLISQASADYTVKAEDAPRLAQINPEVIEAIRRDQIFNPTPTAAALLIVTPTLATQPTLTLVTPLGALEVSTGGPYSGQEGSEILVAAELTNSMLNLVPGTVSYEWDLDSDGQYDDAFEASTTTIFYDEGEYPIRVQATNLLGQVGTAFTVISVSNVPPLVNIGQDTVGEEGQPMVFAATASDPGRDILMYEWDFGDSSPKVTDTLTPPHTFLDNGNFSVRLTVRDNDGGITEDTLAVRVDNLQPEVDAGPNQKTNEGARITFNGTATDPSSFDTLTYAWDFDYDGRNFNTDATGPTASTIYPNGPANVVAALRVRDKDEGETIDTVKVTVVNLPPLITAVANDGPVGEGLPLAVTVTATDAGEDTLTYAFDWEDDGSFDDSGPPNTASNIWYNQGEYTVRIRVDDGDGGQATDAIQVATLNEPPIAIASANSGQPEGTAVGFDASDSSDPGLNDVLTYQWDFGDSTSGSGVNASHAYGDNGEYLATLTVTDDSGASSSSPVAVTIFNANPTATAGSDVAVDEGANVALNYSGAATDPGVGDTLTYAWDFDLQGDFVQDATGPTGTWTYSDLDGLRDPNSNPKIVALRVQDDDYPFSSGGEIGEAVSTFKVTIKNLTPWNVSAGGPYQGVETQQIDLTATAEDAPSDLSSLTYEWDLDDNPVTFEKSGNQISHTWRNAAFYTVRLRVTDKDGGESFASTSVEIGNALPTAVANGPYTSTISIPITLSAAGSSDPTGDPLTYMWRFGDGSPAVITSSLTVTHTYFDDLVYTATLQVDDGRSGTDTATARVTILNQPPIAAATATPNPVAKGMSVTFDSSGTTDPDDGLATLIYQWDFGDGNTGNGPNVNHAYANQGSYTAVLTVIDDDGASNSASINITVNNAPPTAQATANPTTLSEGGSVNFDGRGSTDPGNDPLTYSWDFGDGTNANTAQVVHPYAADGTYQVTLTVTDNSGASSSATLSVTVNNAPPTARATANPTTVSVGGTVNFDGSGSSDPGNDALTYAWDFGDGTSGSGVTVNHSWTISGTYTIILQVDDGQGGVSTDNSVSIQVN